MKKSLLLVISTMTLCACGSSPKIDEVIYTIVSDEYELTYKSTSDNKTTTCEVIKKLFTYNDTNYDLWYVNYNHEETDSRENNSYECLTFQEVGYDFDDTYVYINEDDTWSASFGLSPATIVKSFLKEAKDYKVDKSNVKKITDDYIEFTVGRLQFERTYRVTNDKNRICIYENDKNYNDQSHTLRDIRLLQVVIS